jgi:hypothetical protein
MAARGQIHVNPTAEDALIARLDFRVADEQQASSGLRGGKGGERWGLGGESRA